MVSVLSVLFVCAAAAAGAQAQPQQCLYFSHQNQNEVMIYKAKPGAVPPSVPSGKIYPNNVPTGLAFKDNILYVASYGDGKAKKPAIGRYDTKDYLKALENFKTGPELESCYPEGLAIDGDFLYVGCGVATQAAVLKYNIKTQEFVKVLAKGYPAVYGVTVKNGEVYFASHCTSERVNGKNFCNLYEHDKIFRVSVDGSPEKVKEFAKLPAYSNGDWSEAGWTGLAFGPNGNLYAGSKRKNDVFVFSPFGVYMDSVILRHLERTSDVAFGPDGWGYVGNPGRGRVLRFNPNKEREGGTFAEPGPDIIDSGITYLLWAPCARQRSGPRDEL